MRTVYGKVTRGELSTSPEFLQSRILRNTFEIRNEQFLALTCRVLDMLKRVFDETQDTDIYFTSC